MRQEPRIRSPASATSKSDGDHRIGRGHCSRGHVDKQVTHAITHYVENLPTMSLET